MRHDHAIVMTKRPALIAAIVALLIVAAAAAWWFASPLLTLKDMRDAAAANDADRLSAHIDYPALREDLKADLMARMMAEMGKDKSGFGTIGMAFGSALIGPVIDGMVSPAGLRAAFVAKQNQPAATGLKAAADRPALDIGKDVTIRHDGIDQFAVVPRDPRGGTLIFRRHGLTWKLSGIDLPAAPAR
jgi:hypothetical protein